jgi:hypothetical protein
VKHIGNKKVLRPIHAREIGLWPEGVGHTQLPQCVPKLEVGLRFEPGQSGIRTEWRLDKAQQNGAFLRKWPQRLVGGSRKPGSIPCKPRFPRAGWVSTEAKKDPGGLRPPRGHPEATLRPSGGQPVGTLKPP